MTLINDRLGVLATCFSALILAKWGYKLLSNLVFFLRPSGVQRYLPQKPTVGVKVKESWALITGSGSGIGRALAFELASRGFSIVLHGSNVGKLRAVQEDLQTTHPSISVRTLVLDARICVLLDSADLATKLDEVAKSLQDIQLRILINNVGMPQARPELRAPFDTIDNFSYDELLHNASGNAIFPLLFTRALYPQLVRNEPALIVNLGSIATMGFPLFPSYGPAKAFLMASADELRLENMFERRGVDVLGIDVGGVTGTDTVKEGSNLMLPDATKYAKAIVRSIGCGYPRVAPYMPHAILFWVLDILPSWLKDHVSINMIRTQRQQAVDKLRKKE